MPYIENFEEFKTRQGCECIRGERGSFFENGARALDNLRFEDPPQDPNDLIANKVAFYKTKREELVRKYNSVRDNSIIQADYYSKGWGPPPHRDTAQWLRDRAGEINEVTKTIDGLIESMPERKEQLARQKQLDQARAEQFAQGRQHMIDLQKLPVF